MADQILGLLTSEKFKTEGDRFYNHRRKILHNFPRGGAPLTGLLSLIGEEATNDSKFIWYEKRFAQLRAATRGTNPLTTAAATDGDADSGSAVSSSLGVDTTIYLKVDSTKNFRPGQILQVGASGYLLQILSVVRGVADELLKGYVSVRPVRAFTFSAGDFTAATVLRVNGSAMGEGAAGAGITPLGFKRPYEITNQTWIHRTPFTFSGTVLQEGLKYDKSGPYRERAKDAIIEHMIGWERELLFGRRATRIVPSLTPGEEDEVVRTMSGIQEFLELWDAGSTGLQVDGATYAPYGFKTADTSDDDDTKRVIENTSGTISVDKFNEWAERVGRFHTNKTDEKLVLCGSGALMALHKMFRLESSFQASYGDEAYGLSFTTLLTPFGKFHFMTHPLFTEDVMTRYYMFIVDVHSLKYRPLGKRDTHLLKNRHGNGDDRRKDEYLTEAGVEFWFPENNMLVKNVRNYVTT